MKLNYFLYIYINIFYISQLIIKLTNLVNLYCIIWNKSKFILDNLNWNILYILN